MQQLLTPGHIMIWLGASHDLVHLEMHLMSSGHARGGLASHQVFATLPPCQKTTINWTAWSMQGIIRSWENLQFLMSLDFYIVHLISDCGLSSNNQSPSINYVCTFSHLATKDQIVMASKSTEMWITILQVCDCVVATFFCSNQFQTFIVLWEHVNL